MGNAPYNPETLLANSSYIPLLLKYFSTNIDIDNDISVILLKRQLVNPEYSGIT